MKCTNCGFDAENNSVCPVCGNKLAEEPAPNNQNITQPEVNPYQNPFAQPKPQQNPYNNQNYNTQQAYPPRQNPAPQNNFYPQSPQPQPPVNPYIQPPRQPQNQPPYGAKPYPDYAQNTAPKKSKSNAGIIVLLSIVATVVIIGIVLASLSGVMSTLIPKKSEADVSVIEDDVYDYDYDYDYPENKLDISAQTLNKVGTPVELKSGGTVTLSKVEKVQTNTLDETKAQYAVTIEIKNTTDSDIQSPELGIDYFGEDGQNLLYSSDNDVEFLYDETTDNYLDTIKKGETATRVEYIKASTSLGKIYLLFTEYDHSMLTSEEQEICYEVELK